MAPIAVASWFGTIKLAAAAAAAVAVDSREAPVILQLTSSRPPSCLPFAVRRLQFAGRRALTRSADISSDLSVSCDLT